MDNLKMTVCSLGKKIFFLHPNQVIEEIARELIRYEYEIYLLYDEKSALELFKNYENSILFIYIDEGLSEKEWESYIRSIQADPELSKKVDIGVLTYKRKDETSEILLSDIGIKCGYIQINLFSKESLNIFLNILNINEAKGRRKYLRIKCDDNYISFNIKTNNPSNFDGNDLIKGSIIDISSFGMACKLDINLYDYFNLNTKYNDIQLNLRGFNCKVSATAIMKRDNLIIFKFDENIGNDNKDKIYNFIYKELQKELEKNLHKLKTKK
ncbi:MAG: hypothetical protein JXB50_09290 [Spirochaetes bacterium]|nr:hypothetical protein [Spirochaetota bacterium]